MENQKLLQLATTIIQQLGEKGKTLSVAESCTGGYIGKILTDISGASAVFKGGVISYTNEIKEKVLKVRKTTINRKTEVSCECAAEMAEGVQRLMATDFALSTTGFAGPTGGTEENPTGTVYIGLAGEGYTISFRNFFTGNREEIRQQTIEKAFETLLEKINERG